MVQRFLPLLAENSSERFQVGTVTPDSANANMALIDSRINRSQGEPSRVAWRARETDGNFKILAIVEEGVSMAINLRRKRWDERRVWTEGVNPCKSRGTPQ